jgi:hypothetical protein
MKNHKLDLITKKHSEKTLEKYIEYFNYEDWIYISSDQKLSEEFIEKYSHKIDWYWISKRKNLSEKFIEKHSDKVIWGYISYSQKLSEQFIEKYSDKIDWYWISRAQKLSEKFIKKHINKINIDCLLMENENISDKLKNKINQEIKSLTEII